MPLYHHLHWLTPMNFMSASFTLVTQIVSQALTSATPHCLQVNLPSVGRFGIPSLDMESWGHGKIMDWFCPCFHWSCSITFHLPATHQRHIQDTGIRHILFYIPLKLVFRHANQSPSSSSFGHLWKHFLIYEKASASDQAHLHPIPGTRMTQDAVSLRMLEPFRFPPILLWVDCCRYGTDGEFAPPGYHHPSWLGYHHRFQTFCKVVHIGIDCILPVHGMHQRLQDVTSTSILTEDNTQRSSHHHISVTETSHAVSADHLHSTFWSFSVLACNSLPCGFTTTDRLTLTHRHRDFRLVFSPVYPAWGLLWWSVSSAALGTEDPTTGARI